MPDDNYIPHSRATIEQQIEDLISLLDFLDGDPDREPSLGWPTEYEYHSQSFATGHHARGHDVGDDREGTGSLSLTEDHEPDVDDEVQSWPNPMAENLVGVRT